MAWYDNRFVRGALNVGKNIGYSNPITAPITSYVDSKDLVSRAIGPEDLIPGFDPFTNRSAPSGNTQQNQGHEGGQPTIPIPESGGSTTNSTQTWTPQQQAEYDRAVAEANRQLGRLDPQLQTSLANLGDVYNQRMRGLQSGRNQAQADYDFGMTTNRQNYTTDVNRINSQAAQGLRGLLRQLGVGSMRSFW